MERNAKHPIWKKDKAVLEVQTEGILDISKVKAKFVRQGICTEIEFDTAVTALRRDGLVHASGLKTAHVDIFTIVDGRDAEDNEQRAIAQDQKDAERIFEFERGVPRDSVRNELNVEAGKKLVMLEANE